MEFQEGLEKILGNETLMGEIMRLANSLGAEETASPTKAEESPENPPEPEEKTASLGDLLGSLDPQMIGLAMRLLGEMKREESGRGGELVLAMKPFLSQHRQSHVDKALSYSKYFKMGKIAWAEMKGGERPV